MQKAKQKRTKGAYVRLCLLWRLRAVDVYEYRFGGRLLLYCRSLGPLLDHPLLLVLFLVVHAGRAEWCWVKHASAGTVYRSCIALAGHDSPGFCRMGKVGAQCVLAVSLAKISSSPDASADPDAYYRDNHDDKENNPLVMSLNPAGQESVVVMTEEKGKKCLTMSDFHRYFVLAEVSLLLLMSRSRSRSFVQQVVEPWHKSSCTSPESWSTRQVCRPRHTPP